MSNTMSNFKIRKGLSTELFETDGITVRAGVKLELGCWYLCTDTVCVYICVKKELTEADAPENRILKRVNDTAFNLLENQLKNIEQSITPKYKEIKDEAELPSNFNDPNFDPNQVYYLITDAKNRLVSLYIFNQESQCYVCTNKADFTIAEEQIATIVDIKLEEVLDEKLAEKVPLTVKDTIGTHILFGGDAKCS